MKVYSGTTKVDTIETDLSGVKKALRSRRNKKQDARSSNSRVSTLKTQSAVARGLQCEQRWSESRAARIADLRAQIEIGTYEVDSMTIAESMIENQTYFLED